MKKILALLIVLLPIVSLGQSLLDLNNSILSNDQKLIRSAVDSSLCIIRQDYILKSKNGGEYGRSGKGYFGKAYGLGVMTDNRIWIDIKISTPWETDKYFIENNFQKADTIKPQNYALYISKKGITEFSELKAIPHIYPDSLIISYESSSSLINITSKKESKDSTGWLVIVHSKEDLVKNESSPLSYTIYRPYPKFQSSKGFIKSPSVTENIIGGVYFSQIVSLGKITFVACGILKKIKNNWLIVPLSDKMDKTKPDKLTPIKPKNYNEIEDKKKNTNEVPKQPEEKKNAKSKESLLEI